MMKKVLKSLLMLLSVFFIIFNVVACGNGAKILTDVTLDDDFSGSRIMEVSIAKKTISDYFSGTIDDLKRLINTSCPSQLTYEIIETDSSLICVFSLEFDSINTYKDKVASILGEERELTVLKADSFLSQGITYQENFTSRELLEWFATALIEKKYVDSSYKKEIFESDTTTFMFSSQRYQSKEQIAVSDIQYLPFGNIDILTRPYYDDTYDRVIIFNIPRSTMEKKGDEIIAYLEEGVPNSATMIWDTDNDSGNTIFKVSLIRSDLEDINLAMKSIFHSDMASVESLPYSDKMNILENGHAYKETIDVTNFVSNDLGKAHVRYYAYSYAQPVVEKLNSKGEGTPISGSMNEDYKGYKCILNEDMANISLLVKTKTSYVPDVINIITQVKGRDKIKRNIELVYNSKFEDDETLYFQDSVKKAIEGFAKANFTTQDNGYIIALEQNGTKEEVNIGFQTIFNTPNSYVRYARQKNIASFSLDSVFCEEILLDNLFGYETNKIQINYQAKLNKGENISKESIDYYADYDTTSVKKNIFVMQSDNGRITCEVVSSQFNINFLLFMFLILIFIFAIIIAGYMGYLKLEESGKDIKGFIKRNIQQKKQCNYCKSYIEKNLKYCTKCGSKFEGYYL